MRPRARLQSWVARAAFVSLYGCQPAVEVESLPLSLRQLSGCEIGAPSALELRALGDFPSRSVSVSTGQVSTAFEQLPLATRELSVRATALDGSVAWGRQRIRTIGALQPVVLLPEARSCTLGDDQAGVSDGASVAPLSDGGLLIAGGRDAQGVPQFQAKTLAANAELVEPVRRSMLLRRADATATPVDDSVVVAGGAGDVRGRAQETFEVFDVASASFDGAKNGRLGGPRMQHAALRLPDGRVLIAGGRPDPDGLPLATAELLDFTTTPGSASDVAAGLAHARARPQLLLLDSGNVVALGGSDAQGNLVASAERFDVTTRRFERLTVELPARTQAIAAALPGARVAWLTCGVMESTGCELSLLLEREDALFREDVPLPFDALAPQGLADLQLVALADGELLLTATDPSDTRVRRRAFVIDLDAPSLVAADASRVVSQLVALRTGAVAELGSDGASLRVHDPLSAYDSPTGNLVDAEPRRLVQDVAQHWTRDDDGLHAQVPGARLDVPQLRFMAFRLELDSVGDATLLLQAATERVEIAIAQGRVSVPDCSHQLPAGARLVVTRDGTHVALTTQTGDALCELTVMQGLVGVGVVAAADTRIRSLTLERR